MVGEAVGLSVAEVVALVLSEPSGDPIEELENARAQKAPAEP
jgi:hypothetical protein